MSRFRSIIESTAFPSKSEIDAEWKKWKLTTAELNKEKSRENAVRNGSLTIMVGDSDGDVLGRCAYRDYVLYHDVSGQLHRVGGPASVDFTNGSYEWRIHGYNHRDGGGPAVYFVGKTMIWADHGKIHRVGAPAIIRSDGTFDFYINDKFIPHREAAKHFG